MDIIISNSSDKPIYEQIKQQIKDMVVADTLKAGELLPSIRTLAKELRISVITIKRAYDELENEGFLESVAGKGSFVAFKNKQLLKEEEQKRIEYYIQTAVDIAKLNKITKEALQETLDIIYEEE